MLQNQKTLNHLTTVLNTSASAIVAIDNKLKVLTFNKAAQEMFGYTLEEMQTSNNLHNIIPEQFISQHDKALGSFIKTEKSSGLIKSSVEVKAKHRNGTIFPIKILIDYTGTKENLIIVANIVDITKEKEQEKFLRERSRLAAMGEMTSMIAHQWRQPLTGMGMAINNLLLDIDLHDLDEDRFKENLELVSKQISYLSHTIDDFKNFFKPNKKSEIVNINELIDRSCSVISTSLENHNIKIERNYKKLVTISTKKNDLMQIILNLIKNSMDAYIEKNAKERILYICTNSNEKEITITIKDRAGGISPEVIDKIFNPYFSTKDKKNGTGLGLYMSKMIIEDHLGGTLFVNSKEDTTTFTLTIPRQGES